MVGKFKILLEKMLCDLGGQTHLGAYAAAGGRIVEARPFYATGALRQNQGCCVMCGIGQGPRWLAAASQLLRQREDIEIVAALRDLDVWRELGRAQARAAAAQTSGNGDVLLAVNAVGDGEALHGGAQARLK